MSLERPSDPSPILAGGAAGLALGVSDWAASGLASTPWSLAGADLAACLLAGVAAGSVARIVRKPAAAVGLVTAGAMGLEGLSIVSKELAGSGRFLAGVLVVVLAGLALWACQRCRAARDRGSVLASAGLQASLPMGMLAMALLAESPWVHLAGVAAPLLWLLADGMRSRRSGAPWRLGPSRLGWALLFAPLLWSALERPGAVRRTLPPRTVDGGGSRPSIVLLVIDTLRADAVTSGGSLAEFARGAVDFRSCMGAAPWTLPALGSLFSSLYPSQHGALTAATPLAEDVTTLAELLRAGGYATAAFTGGAFVGPGHHLDQGFEVFDAAAERRFPAFTRHVPLVWRVAKNRYWPARWLVRAVDEYRGLAGGFEAARAWIEREPRRPKFLFLHTYQVHDYYLCDPDVDDAVQAPAPSARFAGRITVHPDELQDASAGDLAYFRALYLGRVAAVERLFPEIERELTARLGPDTIWVVTADHGEGFDAEHGRVHHGGRLHADLLSVPLLVRAPGRLPAGRTVTEGVRSIDVLPTLLELIDLPRPAGLAGESLLGALRGERPFPGPAFAEERAHGFELLAIRRDGWKLIQSPGRTELYHLDEDPLEMRALTDVPPELLEALRSFPALFPARSSPEVELDEATRASLRDLGYVR